MTDALTAAEVPSPTEAKIRSTKVLFSPSPLSFADHLLAQTPRCFRSARQRRDRHCALREAAAAQTRQYNSFVVLNSCEIWHKIRNNPCVSRHRLTFWPLGPSLPPRSVRASTSLSANTKSTPHLTAILNRAASKTKDTFTFRFSSQSQTPAPPLAPTAEYRPSSLPSFLSRLATYKLTTYANKPPSIDAVAASKCGWINDGKDRLVCGLCNASWVVAGREGMNRDAGV